MGKSFLGHIFPLKNKVCVRHLRDRDLTELVAVAQGALGAPKGALGALCQAVLGAQSACQD